MDTRWCKRALRVFFAVTNTAPPPAPSAPLSAKRLQLLLVASRTSGTFDHCKPDRIAIQIYKEKAMSRIKHIVFPVDFSDRSNGAVTFVAEMARRERRQDHAARRGASASRGIAGSD